MAAGRGLLPVLGQARPVSTLRAGTHYNPDPSSPGLLPLSPPHVLTGHDVTEGSAAACLSVSPWGPRSSRSVGVTECGVFAPTAAQNVPSPWGTWAPPVPSSDTCLPRAAPPPPVGPHSPHGLATSHWTPQPPAGPHCPPLSPTSPARPPGVVSSAGTCVCSRGCLRPVDLSGPHREAGSVRLRPQGRGRASLVLRTPPASH